MQSQSSKFAVFVVMPFDRQFRDIYELAIKPACSENSAECLRVDDEVFVENILTRIYRDICEADLVVGEMTGRNPNVFYEVGYAHGAGKTVILVTRTADDIPFDLKHYPHIVYGDSMKYLKQELSAKIRWCVSNPEELQPVGCGIDPELERIGQQIENYLRKNEYTRLSFQRIHDLMGYDERRIRSLIHQSPRKWRFALLKGGAPGIGLVQS